MNFETNNSKSQNNEKKNTLDFSLQSSATKPLDIKRMIGKPVKTQENTTSAQSTSQEGK